MSEMNRRQALKTALTTVAAPALASLGGVHVFGKEAKPAAAAKPARDPYADAVFVDGPPPLPANGNFTIAVMPDTQFYAQTFHKNFHAQTEWIVAHKKDRRIACVLHLGDVTNHNLHPHWKVARSAMNKLDGQVPYFMVAGNHDYSEGGGARDRTTFFTDYFPVKKFQDLPTFGGVYDREPKRMENSYHLFSAGGREFLVVALEFGPRKDVVRWTNEIVAKHPDREAILITHAYMYYDDTRYDWSAYRTKQHWNPHSYGVAKASGGDVLDGEQLWQELVKKHNFIMTLNGHVLADGLGRTTTKNDAGRNVHQMLVNFQMRPQGGDGWLRLLELSPDGKTIDVVDYSPTRNQCNVAPENKFTLQMA